jgi:hypothetical protein
VATAVGLGGKAILLKMASFGQQREGANEIGVSERQVRRIWRNLKMRGDWAVVHGGRGPTIEPEEEIREKEPKILSQDVPLFSDLRWQPWFNWEISSLSCSILHAIP